MIKESLFADQEREDKLNKSGDVLVTLNQYINFKALADALDTAAPRPSRAKGGRPPYPTELMVRILVIQQLFNLSDDQMEFQLLDRLSFQRFTGLRHSSSIPDSKTLWVFKDRLLKAGASETIFKEAGNTNLQQNSKPLRPTGLQAQADFNQMRSGETYLGYAQASGAVSTPYLTPNKTQSYTTPPTLPLNSWGLTGNWQVVDDSVIAKGAGAKITLRFQARDMNLVLGSATQNAPIRFKILLDGQPPHNNHGVDIDASGTGMISDTRLYQLIRQQGSITPQTVEIEFLDSDTQAYVATFG